MHTTKDFYGGDKVKLTLMGFKRHFDNMSTNDIVEHLEALPDEIKISALRVKVNAASMALSDKGIAPYYQGLNQFDVPQSDLIMMDLYWLSNAFKKHRVKSNARWNKLFTEGFNLEIAAGISNRAVTASKRRRILALSEYQQYGCVALIDADVRKRRNALQSRAETVRRKQIKKTNTEPQMTEDRALYRSRIWLAAKFSNCSPQKTADTYKWMTGVTTNRANANRAMKKIGLK